MKKAIPYPFLLLMLLSAAGTKVASANNGIVFSIGPALPLKLTPALPDTVPPPKTQEKEKPAEDAKPVVVKAVPKSRKQMKPLPIPKVIPAKPPVKIIKPKIIKTSAGIIG